MTARSLLVYGALLGVLFLGGGLSGYVYKHEPVRDTLTVRVAPPAEPAGPRTISGTVSALDGTRLTVATAAGPVSVTIPPGAVIDDLVRAPGGLAAGTRVNVGVESTQYGLVLTGVVAVEGAP